MHSPPSPPAAKRLTVVAWAFVTIQVVLLVGIAVGPRDNTWGIGQPLRWAGLGLLVTGAALGLWAALRLGRGLTASPLPNGAIGLVTRGPYRWVRHPMYTAVMLIAAGIATRAGSLVVIALTLALVVLFNIKARWEEGQLAAAFPGYSDYQAMTSRFVPFLTSPLPDHGN